METYRYKNATIHVRGEVDKEKLKKATIQFIKKSYIYKRKKGQSQNEAR